MNKVILKGRIGKDPEIKMTANGQKMAKFSLATSRAWKDKTSGQKKEETQWHNLTAWGSQADFAEKWVKKGKEMLITGEIRYNKVEKDGKSSWFTDITVDNFEFCGSAGNGASEANSDATSSSTETEDDDIPF